MLEIGTILLLLVVATLVAGLLWVARTKLQKKKHAEYEEILDSMTRIAAEARQRSRHLHDAIGRSDDDINQEIARLKLSSPPELMAEIHEIETLWSTLSTQLEEFSSQPSQNTLQSSVITNRAANIARDIERAVDTSRKKLIPS